MQMAKHINKGWSKPGDEIPQPIGVVVLNFQPVIDLYREPAAKARGWL